MVFLAALCLLILGVIGSGCLLIHPCIRCQASFILLNGEEIPPMSDIEHLKLPTYTLFKAGEARLCVLTNEKLSHQRKVCKHLPQRLNAQETGLEPLFFSLTFNNELD